MTGSLDLQTEAPGSILDFSTTSNIHVYVGRLANGVTVPYKTSGISRVSEEFLEYDLKIEGI